jgi:elongation factor P
MEVDLLFDGEEVLDVRIPPHVNLKVTETEPGFKGNTATGATKPATVETGFTLQVPLFIDIDDTLRIDTRTGEYVERVKS